MSDLSDLAEFLLARIGEEAELAARTRGAWTSTLTVAEVFGARGVLMSAERMMAEVAAKRRIVEQYRIYADAQYPDYNGGYCSASEDAMQALAAVYADHPDFRPEWRLDP